MDKSDGDIANTQPERLIKYRVSEDRFTGEVLLPGLWYTDFDRKIGGHMTLWSRAKLFECIRYVLFSNGFGHYDKLIDSKHSIFMASTEYTFCQQFDSIIAKTHWGINFPLCARIRIVNTGTSSFTFEINLYNFKSGEPLASGLLTFVYVNLVTRKSAALPSWYKTTVLKQGQAQERLPALTVPNNAFSFEIMSNSSDIDFNGHVNQSIFVKWCGDAGADAAEKGHYSDFTVDIQKYSVEKIQLRYIGEGMLGQKFAVKTWQDTSVPQTLHFVIMRSQNIIFIAKFTYRNIQAKL